jgi:hypothetical protein
MSAFKLNDVVKFKQPVIQGKVVGAALVGMDVKYMVEFTNEQGETHQVPFDAEQLELVTPAPSVVVAQAPEQA